MSPAAEVEVAAALLAVAETVTVTSGAHPLLVAEAISVFADTETVTALVLG